MFKTFGSILVAVTLVGCGEGRVDVTADDLTNDGDDLTAPQKLEGAWKATDGTLLGLVLTKVDTTKKFVGQQQVWCFRAPCNPVHLEGTWTAAGSRVTLTENGSKTSYLFAVANGVLTLSDFHTKQVIGHLSKVITWCGETTDCGLQSWIHPMCMGGPICAAQQNCGWRCGVGAVAGYGDDCSSALKCGDQLTCQTQDQNTGTCWPSSNGDYCDPAAWKSCGDTLVCALDDNSNSGNSTCQDFAHGQVAGSGYACGGSIGVSCAKGLTCNAPETIGGTGACL